MRARGYPASFLGADRGYTQAQPERFHLPVRALGYSLVMDYKETELGRQANSAGAVMVEGTFYCPAMPEPLVSASADLRQGSSTRPPTAPASRPGRRGASCARKGPDKDGYERFACPARGDHPHLCCPLRPASATGPSARSRCFSHRRTHPRSAPSPQSPSLPTSARAIARTWRSAQRSGLGPMPPTATPSRARTATSKTPPTSPWRRPGAGRVRGIAAQSLFVGLLLMAANFRKIAAYRELVQTGDADKVVARARRRRMSITEYRPPPPAGI